MRLPALLALALALSLTVYAVLAGADFGAGALELMAGKRSSDHEAIAATIGPLWEANHVWLISSITILFSAFPAAFSALGTALLAPLTVALLAIVLRSAALGVRSNPGGRARSQILLGRLFGAASVAAPFAFGTVAGGIAVASVPGARVVQGAPALPWTGAFAVLVGALAAALCAQLAATFVSLNLARSGEDLITERFRRRALGSGVCVLMLSVAALATSAATAPALWHRLVGAGEPALIIGFLAMTLSLLALVGRWYGVGRLLTMLSGAAVLWGWFAAQAPRLIGTHLTIHTAAAPHPALIAIAIAVAVVLLLVLPATYLLFALFGRPVLEVIE
jgi:cytochrome bd ubiquinol oxidase subunit II